jgi:SAM-dependent methyltransferase
LSEHSKPGGDRHGARQKERFNPQRASKLDDPARFEYLPLEEVARLLDMPPASRLVDFGTGTGTYAIELARRRPDVEVIALDELPEMLERLRAKPAAANLPNLHPMLAEHARGLEGKNDRVLALNVLHELGDAALRDLGALLKPQGSALFIDWNAEAERPAGPPADHLYNPAEARERLELMGFQIEMQHLFPYQYALRVRRR